MTRTLYNYRSLSVSGGPLIDLNGNVVGVNLAPVMGGNDIGFAISADMVKEILAKQNLE